MRAWSRHHLAWIIGVGICFTFAISIYAIVNANDRRRSACIDLEALKTITRNEKQASVKKTARILKQHHIDPKHPRGLIFGIPAKLFVDSNADQRAIIRQLEPRNC